MNIFLTLLPILIFLYSSFTVDRSLICLSDTNSQPVVNRSSTNTGLQWRSVDIRNSMEYRELEKQNKDLSSKIENLKDALSKERKGRKQMNETHICKLSSYVIE
jgi:TolA-binding protein